MSQNVLSLGEKIVLASRLATIEHVRQVLEDDEHRRQQFNQLQDLFNPEASDPVFATDSLRQKWKAFFMQAGKEAA